MRTIRQRATFKAKPRDVYDALMDSAKHAAFSGGAAKIGSKVGDAFSAYDGYITGTNLELIRGKKIVQAWHANDDGWAADHHSTVAFELTPITGGTRLAFTQTDVPEESADRIASGWREFYWDAMKATFGW